jgi:hypothetical protein
VTTLAACLLLLALVLAADVLARRLSGRWRAVPLLALSIALAVATVELARNPRGFAAEVGAITFIAAPVIVIFGGAAAGVRRWYGWPDLGPLPGRFALAAVALLVGTLIGSRFRDDDVAVSKERGQEIARALLARKAVTGAWPLRLEDVVDPVPRTRFGWFASPPFEWKPADATLSLPVPYGGAKSFVLHVDSAGASWELTR